MADQLNIQAGIGLGIEENRAARQQLWFGELQMRGGLIIGDNANNIVSEISRETGFNKVVEKENNLYLSVTAPAAYLERRRNQLGLIEQYLAADYGRATLYGKSTGMNDDQIKKYAKSVSDRKEKEYMAELNRVFPLKYTEKAQKRLLRDN